MALRSFCAIASILAMFFDIMSLLAEFESIQGPSNLLQIAAADKRFSPWSCQFYADLLMCRPPKSCE
jgi:hypothetical protein